MTKSGASGPKARARKIQRATGVSYTQARGIRQTPRRGRIVQFLFQDAYDLGTLAVQISTAWARRGLKVVLMHEWESYPISLDLVSRRAKVRQAAEKRMQEWPGHRSSVLWRSTASRGGLLVEQHTAWRPPIAAAGQADPRRLPHALELGRRQFDAVVLMDRPTWPHRGLADHFIVLAASTGVPTRETLAHGPTPDHLIESPIAPAQSAALLRERHLPFLWHRPATFTGMITASRTEPTAEPAPGYVDAVRANMAAAGIPLLGHIHVSQRDLATHTLPNQSRRLANSPLDPGIEETARTITNRW